VAIIENNGRQRPKSFFQFWMKEVLDGGGELVLFSDLPPAELPTAVEGLPLDQAGEAWKWADYLAADVDLDQLDHLLRILKPERDSRLPEKAEVLVRTPMPCGGQAECGLCAVITSSGPRLACKTGPVFSLDELAGKRRG
jgi:dihydroorotate dehydrogenase electron transfer subunit